MGHWLKTYCRPIYDLIWFGLPERCIHCDYLKRCRKPWYKGHGCYNGCLIINHKKEYMRHNKGAG